MVGPLPKPPQRYQISVLTSLDLAPCEPHHVNCTMFHHVLTKSQEASERTPHWMKGGTSFRVSRRHDPRTMGLGPALEPRLNAVSMAPRLCHMSAGGPRRFTIGDSEFARAMSPYELERLVLEALGRNRFSPMRRFSKLGGDLIGRGPTKNKNVNSKLKTHHILYTIYVYLI